MNVRKLKLGMGHFTSRNVDYSKFEAVRVMRKIGENKNIWKAITNRKDQSKTPFQTLKINKRDIKNRKRKDILKVKCL